MHRMVIETLFVTVKPENQYKCASNYFILIHMTSTLCRKNAVIDLHIRMTFISLFLWEKKMLDMKEQYLVASE